jgi:hypothetical protein
VARIEGTKIRVPAPKGSFPNPADLVARNQPVLPNKQLPPVPAVPLGTPTPFPQIPVGKVKAAFRGAGQKDDTKLAAFRDPVVSGLLHTGNTLTVAPGGWVGDDVVLTRQWVRANDAAGTGQANIVGQTGLTYVIAAGDASKFIACVETATEGRANNAETLSRTSNYVGPAVNP